MSYDPTRQYRCTIIRGKSISKMDDYLPIYADILNSICPVAEDEFADLFDQKLSHFIEDDIKTIRNHRTENAGKLLGMYYTIDDIVYLSKRTVKFLQDRDQPAFFKSVCYRFQQPNGSQKINTIAANIKHEIKIKPYHFVIALLKLSYDHAVILSKDEIAYYVLNSLDVLQGKVTPEEVFATIVEGREKKLMVKVEVEGKAHSYSMQHINEQLDYLVLANLIRIENKLIWLNTEEQSTIKLFTEHMHEPMFEFSKYNLEEVNISKQIELDWQAYFGYVSEDEALCFSTKLSSLNKAENISDHILNCYVMGQEAEKYILELEKERVKKFNRRLVNKVNIHVSKKGLGYDITSIEADRNPENPEFIRYIEVKANKRVHAPDFSCMRDTVSLTRNEWVAAEQHRKHYYIYRVYFTTEGVFVNIINDPFGKFLAKKLYSVPVSYRLEFDDNVVDEHVELSIETL